MSTYMDDWGLGGLSSIYSTKGSALVTMKRNMRTKISARRVRRGMGGWG